MTDDDKTLYAPIFERDGLDKSIFPAFDVHVPLPSDTAPAPAAQPTPAKQSAQSAG